jgi:LSD1 subclass zinc finger protein
MTFFKRSVRPAFIVLALCLLVFAWEWNQVASIRREVASSLAELQADQPPLTLDGFSRNYLSDPFGKAVGMSRRQLQLCQQLSARVPVYEAAVGWRNNALFLAIVTGLYLLFRRYRSRLPMDRWRLALRGFFQRLALRLAPVMAEARRRVAEKRQGRSAAATAGSSPSGGTVYDIVACPTCGQKLRLPTGKGALRVKCSGCHTVFDCRT